MHTNSGSHDHLRSRMIEWVQTLTEQLEALSRSSQAEIPKKIVSVLQAVGHYKGEFARLLREENIDLQALQESSTALESRAKRILEVIETEPINPEIFEQLRSLIVTLRNGPSLLNHSAGTENFREMLDNAELAHMSQAVNILASQLASARNENNSLRREVKDAQRTVGELSENLASLSDRINDAISDAIKKAEAITEDLVQKQDEVNKLAGIVSGSTMANSFAKSAAEEKSLANSMRNGSVLLMLTVVAIVGFSFFETTNPQFDWQTAAFRLLFSLALSIPAAYLARESSKHRAQQNSHLRISLDLQAITPYLASLPTEEQHKLKMDVANKIFGAKDAAASLPESYPLNINDLLKLLISRIEPKDSKKKADSDD